uniref:RNA-directed DNA polymerase n=1 Tax=Tanacetum cinerariifolium TaxID=118510 RepID=A0A6L2JAS5_TANCI|nr:RNA-directed DNA polymerase [Tanacetum cinerariifolium]
MEVDLSIGMQLVYTFPDMILSVNEFHNHVEVAIQTHGYDTWQRGESNLLITMAFTSYMGFQYSVENVVDHVTTNGITAIPDERRNIEDLEGMSWNLKPPEQTSVRVPSRVVVNERLNISVSIQFERYRQAPQPPRYSVDQHDREVIGNDNLDEDGEHFVGICLQTPQIEHTPYDSTLGEPFGKWDYYVRYDAPENTTPIEEIAATGLGDKFYDDEITPRRVTNLNESEERSDLNDNERSELEWEFPFTAKRGKDHTVLHISKNEEKDDDLPYPKFRKFKQLAVQIIKKHEEHAFPTAIDDAESSTSYQPPPDAIMRPAVYPQQDITHNKYINQTTSLAILKEKAILFMEYGEYHNSQWTLPPALMESGVMLFLTSRSMPMQWRTAYLRAYSALEIITDDPQSITSQVRQLIIMEDLYRGSTDEQDRAYRDLDRITCEENKNLWSFLEDFLQLAIKSGKLYFTSTREKLFAKLPPSLSKKIEELFKARHHSLSAGVLPAIKFTHTFVSEMCKDVVLAKELRDLSLCSAIPIPGYYKYNRKKYRIRSSRTYKGKPHKSHVKPFKRKYKDDRGRVKKCKCFICRKEGHFAKDYRSKQGNIARSTVYQELDLDDNWDIVSADFDDSSVYSISKGEERTEQEQQMIRDQAKEYYKGQIAMREKEELWQTERSLLEKRDKEIEVQFSKEEIPPLGNSHIARPFMEAKAHYFGNTTTAPKIRKITNQLYNVKVEFEIPSCPIFRTTAIIDTGASACCINKEVIPEEALEPLTQMVFFNGLNLRQQATHSIKQGPFLIEGNKFKIPLIYAFDMKDNNDIEMLIGANFLRSIKGGIRIEGDKITIYKKVTRIKTSNQNEKEHAKHLEKMLKICEDNGLVLSPTKMKIAVSTIDFLERP